MADGSQPHLIPPWNNSQDTTQPPKKKKVQINGLKLVGTASVCPVKILIERRYGMERKKGKEGSDRPYRLSALFPDGFSTCTLKHLDQILFELVACLLSPLHQYVYKFLWCHVAIVVLTLYPAECLLRHTSPIYINVCLYVFVCVARHIPLYPGILT